MSGIGKINFDDKFTIKNEGETFRLRVSYGRFFHPKTSLGIGLGLDGYSNYNTLPIFLELRRFAQTDESSWFAFLNMGAAVELSQEFEKGLHASTGIGYRIKKRRIAWLPSIGINLQRIAEARAILLNPATNQFDYIVTGISLYSISFNLGIQF